MKNIIVGTAGHIDHGKTTLIKALTGRETDRLKEEQKRGISIELGFTFFDLPSGRRAGVIDVPGHEKFIKNMLAGVMGIDIVMLVVAADEGVMPQTIEHLAILNLLGIEKGFVVLTKSDLVEEEWLELVKEDVREEIKGTFLEKQPIIPVSSKTKEGTAEVLELIDEMAVEIDDRETDDMPRLPVDRVFSISGFGTIVTGTLISGKLKVGDEIQVFPKGVVGRVRSLQVHDEDRQEAFAGQRVAINISGVKTDEIDRGDMVAPVNSMKSTMMLDTKIKILNSQERIIENRTRVRLYIGSKELLCRMIILDKEFLKPGDEAYCQLRLEEPTVAKRGDRFILRFYSPMFTIGGGYVLETNPGKKKRFNEKDIEELEIKDSGNTKDVIEKIVLDTKDKFLTVKELSVSTSMLEENVEKDIKELEAESKVISFTLTKEVFLIHKNNYQAIRDDIIDDLKKFHKDYPLRQGKSKEEIRSKFLTNTKPKTGDRFLDLLLEEEHIGRQSEYLHINGFSVEYTESQKLLRDSMIDLFKKSSFTPPKLEEVYEALDASENEVKEVFLSLTGKGIIVKLADDIYLLKDSYDEALEKLKAYLSKNGSINVGEFRDLLDTNRKTAISLLENFDQNKITKRDGDRRVLI